ncbi:aminofutalosine synthase MqnE [Tenuifilum thalassicum]|uniref:Aminodeoxyfutalosine synthase n=1 Tax=Tenuifilum thalassicum TaxID=2590900 RepID=A0A7D4BEK2_9BACT|nr:aminofutalosine synthase MqnE [Tenuifilum thalassicum]QKG80783.1 aminofutalosine synthase MqnE [Tenuifilum thalassicum]
MKPLIEDINPKTEDERLASIIDKVISGERINADDGIYLYEHADLALLSQLANLANHRLNGNYILFNKNFHIEPTNLCVFNCKFCSYHKSAGDSESWVLTLEEIKNAARKYINTDVTEVHIVGGVHPKWNIDYYGEMIKAVKEILPHIHVKAYSAIELDFIIRKSKLSYSEGLKRLKDYGLDSIPGGGAEIFAPEVRAKICPEKASGDAWLAIHKAAHENGIQSNATMLYGHIESYKHRVQHMEAIRKLQDETHGFNCFIPLKFRAANNPMGYLGEVNMVEDLRNFAVSRIYMDNIRHLKAYWPMLGIQNTKMAINFGVDDIDGTIDDTTKIYSMAGAEEQKPTMTVERLTQIVREAGGIPAERDSIYNIIKVYD